MGFDCFAYTFIGVRIPQERLWQNNFLKHCECYDEKRYCEECSGESLTLQCAAEEATFEYGYEMIDNERSNGHLYICILKEVHDCKDAKEVVRGALSLEELIRKRELLKTILLREKLLQDEDEFRQLFGVYTRANFDY
jgi:hypothetical protein